MSRRLEASGGRAIAGGRSVGSLMGTHLWMHWLDIAAERAHAAEAARALAAASGADGERFSEALASEMQAAMVAIASASHAIDALYGEVKPMIPVPQAMRDTWACNRTARHDVIFETLKIGCKLGDRTNRWPRQFQALYVLRDQVVHHQLRRRPSVPHPVGGTDVSQGMADYVVENVRTSLDLAFDVVLTTITRPRAPDLVAWTGGMPHVPATIERYRSRWAAGSAPG